VKKTAKTDGERAKSFRDRQKSTPELKKHFNDKEAKRKALERCRKNELRNINSDNDQGTILSSSFLAILKDDLAPDQSKIEICKNLLNILDN
jgi:hypothetical protein